ncbi:unnamed protein product, partial [Urochloa humidicola]
KEGLAVAVAPSKRDVLDKTTHSLMDCLNWRIQNEIDSVLGGPQKIYK